MCPPIAQKPNKKTPESKQSAKRNAAKKRAPKKTEEVSSAKKGSSVALTDPLLLKTQELVSQKGTGRKTATTEAALVQNALALMQQIKTQFKITDEALAKSLASFAIGPPLVAAKGQHRGLITSPQRHRIFYSLFPGVLDQEFLRSWANDAGTRLFDNLLEYHPKLKKGKQPWQQFTTSRLGDFLYSVVGEDRPVIGWLDVLAEDFKLEQYGAERLRNLIHEAKQVMPAEFQAHVNHYVRDPSLRCRMMSILLRVAWMFECPVKFTLVSSALVGRSALAYRNFGEMQAHPRIKVFRALCEYFIFGQNTTFFCSLYNITRAQLKTAVEWVQSNLTVK